MLMAWLYDKLHGMAANSARLENWKLVWDLQHICLDPATILLWDTQVMVKDEYKPHKED